MHNLPIFQCLKIRKIDPDQLVYIFVNSDESDERVTLGNIFEQSNRMAHVLLKAGIGPGDTFTMIMRNYPEFLYALFGALSIGAIAVPVDPRSKGDKLAFQINNTRSKALLISDEFINSVREIEGQIKDTRVAGVLYKAHHQTPVATDWPSLADEMAGASAGLPDKVVPFSKKNPVQIIHTSGTTGDPKGVVLKADRFRQYALLDRLVWKYKNDDILYTGLSMTHGNAQSVTVLPALARTGFPSLGRKTITAVISEKFTKSRIWDICRKYNCTTFSLLGGMMSGIFNEPPKDNDADNPVRRVISAGTPQAIWEDFEKRFGVQIHEWYAAIEGGLAHNPPWKKGPIGSFGKNPPFMRMKIVDENDRETAPGERGELVSKMIIGPTQVNYFGKKKESSDKTRGGWLHSGDICHRDEKGFFYFDFRKGGGLRRQGDFIQPDFVERVVGEHETVSEACVYGIPASSHAPGESDLVVAVTPFVGLTVDLDGVRELCREKLEANSLPSYFQLVDEIPKSSSEKYLSRLLKDAFSPDAENVVPF
ncbi:MAG: AMP-binding protein [Thermodesulfobacteriota bacterium]|nr:AMP-binding protein [Thermodesulfobacteriota bacterium]